MDGDPPAWCGWERESQWLARRRYGLSTLLSLYQQIVICVVYLITCHAACRLRESLAFASIFFVIEHPLERTLPLLLSTMHL